MRKILYSLRIIIPTCIIATSIWTSCNNTNKNTKSEEGYVGSKSCRECHERFYELWAPSHHGLAMQPVTKEFLKNDSIPSSDTFHIEGSIFQTKVINGKLFLIEEHNGTKKEYQSKDVTGGKYIYYFLIPLEKGKLQVMPIAYDKRNKEWYNNPQSGVRHFIDGEEDAPLDWKNPTYTFNSNCIACHVSQSDIGFDEETMIYNTKWAEPGINCEACHGPSAEHEKVCREAPEGTVPDDLKIIMAPHMGNERDNSSCLVCHAQMRPITNNFMAGDRFYDHYILNTLEDIDHYPDGRDLGENFTMLTWELSKCNINKEYECIDCHTSSGRYRFADQKIANNACMPCHTERVNNPEPHTHHSGGENGITCVDCHMAKTDFARMDRSDHSNRPPLPAATIEFGSPNACNICHDDKSAEWANKIVKEWHPTNFQEPHLIKARLVRQARKQDWTNVNDMFGYITKNTDDAIYVNSLIRLLDPYPGEEKWPVILSAAENNSPLVRSSVARSLADYPVSTAKEKLLKLINDDYRAVRVEAAYSVHRWTKNMFSPQEWETCKTAIAEYKNSMTARPDDWSSHYNLGNFYTEVHDFENAINSYQKSLEINNNQVMTNVNIGMTYAYSQNYNTAEKYLLKALEIEPNNEITLINYALLMVEMQDLMAAENSYRKAYKINPKLAQAAYNIAILVANRNTTEAEEWAKRATEAAPENSTYSYTYAFYLSENNKNFEAVNQLIKLIENNPYYVDAYMFLAQLYHENNDTDSAIKLLNKALKIPNIEAAARQRINMLLNQLTS